VNLYEPEEEPETEAASAGTQPHQQKFGLWDRVVRGLKKLMGKESLADELFASLEAQMILYQDLKRKVGGDRAVVERLVDYEKQRCPDADRSAWLAAATARWDSDHL
jgi:hypothetical protein